MIPALELHKPKPTTVDKFDIMNPNYSWLRLTKNEILEINIKFLKEIAPKNADP